jgi:hypothetical protein
VERSALRPCRKTDGRHKGTDGLTSTIVPARDIAPPVGGTRVSPRSFCLGPLKRLGCWDLSNRTRYRLPTYGA